MSNMSMEALGGVVPALDWVRLAPSAHTREQWCADGDGMVVVKRSKGGFRAMDQNQRKYIGLYKTLGEAIAAAEAWMKEHDSELFNYVFEMWPFAGWKEAA